MPFGEQIPFITTPTPFSQNCEFLPLSKIFDSAPGPGVPYTDITALTLCVISEKYHIPQEGNLVW